MVTVSAIYDGLFADVTHCHRERVVVQGDKVSHLLRLLMEKYGQRFSELALDGQGLGIAPGITILGDGRRLDSQDPLMEGAEVVFLVSFAGG